MNERLTQERKEIDEPSASLSSNISRTEEVVEPRTPPTSNLGSETPTDNASVEKVSNEREDEGTNKSSLRADTPHPTEDNNVVQVK
ncbi:Hypothetical protein FKW44_012826 [Caligus rogercresseyi]|uniref:Uncharacterized protein n=1 Tax=Caligus rogercresseyi TaxID=217165 RepID=A0A7T8HK07_CALRO|nr:Hypothetical protein FKW44_012826 [Caligus rogercresseyi]